MEDTAPSRSNRFDTMRLVFALVVVVSHSFTLPDLAGTRATQDVLAQLSELAIQGFFILSGALVYGSWLRTDSISRYAAKRVRRLYPAYVTVILLTVVIAFMAVPEVRADMGTTLRYIAANLSFLNFLQPTLPGVFEGQRFQEINGALWTLKIEVMFYIGLPILVWMMSSVGRFKYGLLILIYIAAEVWRFGFEHLGREQGSYALIQISRQLPGQMSFFVAGILLWEFRHLVSSRWWLFGLIGLSVLIASYLPGMEFVRAAGWCALLGGLAFSPGPELNAARFGDFSYGAYITHFPIIQTVIAFGVFSCANWAGFALAYVMTLAVAIAFWHLIEKRFLASNNWYRKQARGHISA